MVDDLSMCNIVGFANFTVAGHRRTRLRVLGLLLDGPGIPVNLARRSQTPPRVEGPSPRVVLVAGSSMDAGKTTCAVALARHLRAAGRRITFEKKTGTTCFADPLKVQVEDPLAFGATDTSLTVSRDDLRVCDFVDATGMVSDISGDLTQFVERSLAFTPWFTATRGSDVHIVELADNLSHVSNLALARDCRFRQMVSGLVYVPSPSFDAAHHMLAFLRESLDWPDLPVAFSGPIANDLEWEAVRLEVEARLGVPCLPSRGRATAALADWAQTCVTRKRGAG
jgi:hypothetical protein